MCMFSSPPKAEPPQAPPEYAQQKTPDYAAAQSSAARRASDRIKGAPSTILTSPSGAPVLADTQSPALSGNALKKTLLGQ
ncbi:MULTISPECIES: hypothetical protein [unclassified Rhizobium]|uniref:hypothetical protein n=1 Tax=Rhizobium sp. GCM10022189 TaxID=3252654 RepID=UPI000DD73806